MSIKVGSYVGTGAAISIELGYIPDHVRIVKETDGDVAWEWYRGMANGHAMQATNNASTQFSRITANGVTPYLGTPADKSAGFTIGSALSEAGKTFRYIASRERD